MKKKYQIFVSSTYDDLKEERNQVIKAILEMGHIPVGMEMFSAADEEQWQMITRQIDESDYYVIIVAHRYGSLSENISYTEKEFSYAIEKQIPIYGFIVADNVQALAINCDTDAKKKVALEKFKVRVRKKPVSFWNNPDDLHGKVAIALMKAFNTTPRVGWSRAVGADSPEISLELSRLSKENAELRAQLSAVTERKEDDKNAQNLSVLESLKSLKRTLMLKEKDKATWDLSVKVTMYEIFKELGPELIVEKSAVDIGSFMARVMSPLESKLASHYPMPSNHVKAILADFNALGLVHPSVKKHVVSDKNEYWTLTPQGSDVLKLDRVQQLDLEKLNFKAEGL